jgi:hypothetical protein
MDLLRFAAEGLDSSFATNPADWSAEEICAHLETQSWSHPDLLAAVAKHRINGEAFLLLNKADLVEFGIENPMDCNRILTNIMQLTAAKVRNKHNVTQDSYDDIVIGMELPTVAFISSRKSPRKSKYASPQSSASQDQKSSNGAAAPAAGSPPTTPKAVPTSYSPAPDGGPPRGDDLLRRRLDPTIFIPSAPTRKFGSPKKAPSPMNRAFPETPVVA